MKILSYLLSPIFGIVFMTILCVFHPLQWLGLKLFGYKGHMRVVEVLNFCLIKSLLILGIQVRFKMNYDLPKGKTMIFVSNHQGMFDIPPIVWYLRKFHAKFVSKIELGKGIPSISFNLRHGGAALIDRKDGRKSLQVLATFAKRIEKNKWSAAIFPEGTRSKDGRPKSFSPNGLKILAKYNPTAYIVPITINNSWKVFRYGKFPLGLGAPITLELHEPIKIDTMSFEELFVKVETAVKSKIK